MNYFIDTIFPKVAEALDDLIHYANDEGEHRGSKRLARVMSLSLELLCLMNDEATSESEEYSDEKFQFFLRHHERNK
jgi:hypothetical protein